MFTTPTLAIQPMKLLQTSVADPDDAPDAAMGISSEGLKRNGYTCVAIILYFVKKRNPLRRFAPQIAARSARDDGDSVPEPLTTFMLRDERIKIWWASLRRSVGCRWICWSYSQPRTGVVNRFPGIYDSNRTPLARFHTGQIYCRNNQCTITTKSKHRFDRYAWAPMTMPMSTMKSTNEEHCLCIRL